LQVQAETRKINLISHDDSFISEEDFFFTMFANYKTKYSKRKC